jgi:Tol biopolymer transport system component
VEVSEVRFGVWACTVLAATMIVGVAPAVEVQSSVVDQDAAVEEIRGAVPPRSPGDEAEVDEPDENTARETGGEPVPGAIESSVTGKESPPAKELPEGVTVEREAEREGARAVEPLWIRELIGIEPGHNDSNPVWSPSGELIAFERSIGDKKEIIIASQVGVIVQKIYLQLADNDEKQFFLPDTFEEVSYNSGISWSPGGERFVVMSNGGAGNYDIYLGAVGSEGTQRLTDHTAKDGLAHWSPVDDHLVFVSGRTGHGDIYLMDLTTRALRRLTQGDKAYLYPQWSPDGQRIVMIYGSNENHDIYLIGDVKDPLGTLKPLTTWPYDDLRPVWSPDGTKIAFYTNYNVENDPKVWSLVVIAADGSDSTEGEGLAMKIVAMDIIPDVEQGPAWMPDSNTIVYVKNDRQAYNPIYIVDIEKKAHFLVRTGAKMNHDVTCSVDGMIAFRAQVEQWDHIHVTRVLDIEGSFSPPERTEYETDRSVLPHGCPDGSAGIPST